MSKTIDVTPVLTSNNGLTGKFRFRTNIFGRLILQVQFSITDEDPHGSHTRVNWRDASVEDLTLLEPKD